ncbi:hypothetical protein [Fictibacillus fluitans]|uniref:Uncharacterized protein n=1 Tax=Fictibacillus fluitans TaxID=3058422 RepID=A0ABT8HRG5_9BACL|nr:hypothetical protein [Fictibacillus sp. NE201]MDN4523331.1 hypothetical protein [Fictibacillus sp. NE201]
MITLLSGPLLVLGLIYAFYESVDSTWNTSQPKKEQAYFSGILLQKQIERTYYKFDYISSAHQIKNIPVFWNYLDDIHFNNLSVLSNNIPDESLTKDISNIEELEQLIKKDKDPKAVVYLHRILSDLTHKESRYGLTYTFEGDRIDKVNNLIEKQ